MMALARYLAVVAFGLALLALLALTAIALALVVYGAGGS